MSHNHTSLLFIKEPITPVSMGLIDPLSCHPFDSGRVSIDTDILFPSGFFKVDSISKYYNRMYMNKTGMRILCGPKYGYIPRYRVYPNWHSKEHLGILLSLCSTKDMRITAIECKVDILSPCTCTQIADATNHKWTRTIQTCGTTEYFNSAEEEQLVIYDKGKQADIPTPEGLHFTRIERDVKFTAKQGFGWMKIDGTIGRLGGRAYLHRHCKRRRDFKYSRSRGLRKKKFFTMKQLLEGKLPHHLTGAMARLTIYDIYSSYGSKYIQQLIILRREGVTMGRKHLMALRKERRGRGMSESQLRTMLGKLNLLVDVEAEYARAIEWYRANVIAMLCNEGPIEVFNVVKHIAAVYRPYPHRATNPAVMGNVWDGDSSPQGDSMVDVCILGKGA